MMSWTKEDEKQFQEGLKYFPKEDEK